MTLNKNLLIVLGAIFFLYIVVEGSMPSAVIHVALGLLWGAVVISALWKNATK